MTDPRSVDVIKATLRRAYALRKVRVVRCSLRNSPAATPSCLMEQPAYVKQITMRCPKEIHQFVFTVLTAALRNSVRIL